MNPLSTAPVQDGLTPESAFLDITSAILAIPEGSAIIVMAGVYDEGLTYADIRGLVIDKDNLTFILHPNAYIQNTLGGAISCVYVDGAYGLQWHGGIINGTALNKDGIIFDYPAGAVDSASKFYDLQIQLTQYAVRLGYGVGTGVANLMFYNSLFILNLCHIYNDGAALLNYWKDCKFVNAADPALAALDFSSALGSAAIIFENCKIEGVEAGGSAVAISIPAASWDFAFIDCSIDPLLTITNLATDTLFFLKKRSETHPIATLTDQWFTNLTTFLTLNPNGHPFKIRAYIDVQALTNGANLTLVCEVYNATATDWRAITPNGAVVVAAATTSIIDLGALWQTLGVNDIIRFRLQSNQNGDDGRSIYLWYTIDWY